MARQRKRVEIFYLGVDEPQVVYMTPRLMIAWERELGKFKDKADDLETLYRVTHAVIGDHRPYDEWLDSLEDIEWILAPNAGGEAGPTK